MDISGPDPVVSARNIYQRLNEVRKAVAYVKKDKRVDAQNYMAVTHDAVTALVREHLVAHGIMVVPTLIVARTVQDSGMATSKGVPIIRYEATYDIHFVNCDQPDDQIALRIESHALDQGDKAPGKAISYATKYAMLKLLSLETGEDDEQRTPAQATKATNTPTTGVMDRLTLVQQAKVSRTVDAVVDAFAAEQPEAALHFIDHAELETEEKVAVWSFLDSKQRSQLKKLAEERKNVRAENIKAEPGSTVQEPKQA